MQNFAKRFVKVLLGLFLIFIIALFVCIVFSKAIKYEENKDYLYQIVDKHGNPVVADMFASVDRPTSHDKTYANKIIVETPDRYVGVLNSSNGEYDIFPSEFAHLYPLSGSSVPIYTGFYKRGNTKSSAKYLINEKGKVLYRATVVRKANDGFAYWFGYDETDDSFIVFDEEFKYPYFITKGWENYEKAEFISDNYVLISPSRGTPGENSFRLLKQKIYNLNGEMVVPPYYREVKLDDEIDNVGIFVVRAKQGYGVVDSRKKIIVPPVFDLIGTNTKGSYCGALVEKDENGAANPKTLKWACYRMDDGYDSNPALEKIIYIIGKEFVAKQRDTITSRPEKRLLKRGEIPNFDINTLKEEAEAKDNE